MKDYSRIARKYGVIDSYMKTNDYIESYKINKENNFVEIVFMDGARRIDPIYEGLIEELDEVQLDQLQEMYKQLSPKIDNRIRWQGGLFFLNGTNAALQYTVGHWFAGTCWLLASGLYFSQCYFPHKLKKEMQLVSWIMDHKELVDQMIKTEVDSHMISADNMHTTNLVKPDYPTDLVPYSEDIYQEGINLSNIDQIKVKELKKIKKKIVKR